MTNPSNHEVTEATEATVLEVTDPRIVEGLEKRMAEYEANPSSATTWEAIRAKLTGKR